MDKKTYLFDWDNTLLDPVIYRNIYPKIISYLVKTSGLSESQIYENIRFKVRKYGDGNFDTGEMCSVFGEMGFYYKVLSEEVKDKDYLIRKNVDLLLRLKKEGNTIGIVSNSFTDTIKTYIQSYGLSKHIDFIFTQTEAMLRKDMPDFWEKLIKVHSLDPKRCVVIGDDPFEDGVMPKRFGFETRKT